MLAIQNFILMHSDWRELLSSPPYSLRIKQEGPLILFNYSQIDSDPSLPIVQEARGLVLEDDTYRIVRKGFNRFFNYGETNAAEIDWTSTTATMKEDGTLIFIYNYGGKWLVGTRNSLDARTASTNNELYPTFYDLFEVAAKKSHLNFAELDTNKTYVFELATPFNLIVVQYKDFYLFHLSTFDNTTGAELYNDTISVSRPEYYHFSSQEEYQHLVDSFDENVEGIVVRDINGNRVKMKTPLYFQLHRMANNGHMNVEKAVDLILANETSEFLVYFPQWADFIHAIEIEIKAIHYEILDVEQKARSFVEEGYTKKDIALSTISPWIKPFYFEYYSHGTITLDKRKIMKLLQVYYGH